LIKYKKHTAFVVYIWRQGLFADHHQSVHLSSSVHHAQTVDALLFAVEAAPSTIVFLNREEISTASILVSFICGLKMVVFY
jgi:hypothetical protein